MTCHIISPTTLTDAMLTSSTAPETDATVWAAGTFAVGNIRMMTTGIHRRYECLVAHTSTDASGAPNLNTTGLTPKWLDLGATNRWAMFDNKVGTKTTLASPLTVVLAPGSVSGLALLEMSGAQLDVTVKSGPGGTTVYSKTVVLDGTVITSFYDWFFEDYVQQTDLMLTDLPAQYTSPEVTLSITGTTNVSIGVCHFGKAHAVGTAKYGASLGIISYSTKTTDTWGNVSVTKRANSKRLSATLVTAKADMQRIYRLLAAIDSVPVVVSVTDVAGYEAMIAYAFYKDFSLVAEYYDEQLLSLEFEGLI